MTDERRVTAEQAVDLCRETGAVVAFETRGSRLVLLPRADFEALAVAAGADPERLKQALDPR